MGTITHTHDMSHTSHMTHMRHVGDESHVSERHGGAIAYGDTCCFTLQSMHPHLSRRDAGTPLLSAQSSQSSAVSTATRLKSVRCHTPQVLLLSGLKIGRRMQVTVAWPRRIATCIATHTDNMHQQHPHRLCVGPIGRAAAFSQPGLLGRNGATLDFLASASVASILVTRVRRSRRTGCVSWHLTLSLGMSLSRHLHFRLSSTLRFLLNLPKIIYVCTYTCIRIYIYICIHIHTSV